MRIDSHLRPPKKSAYVKASWMPAAEERSRELGRQASEKPRGRKPRAGVARRCRARGLSMGMWDLYGDWGSAPDRTAWGGGLVRRGAGREIAVAECLWTIVAVDGDGAVPDPARRSGHEASPLFRSIANGGVRQVWAAAAGNHELSIWVGIVGRSRGAHPRSKVSIMIMRPPQQGQGCESVRASTSPVPPVSAGSTCAAVTLSN
jgi:hypothetical protein